MKKIGEPSDAQLIHTAIRARLADVRTAIPAMIVDYDFAKQTCTAKPAVRIPTLDGVPEELDPIPDVPVKWMRGGGYFATMPLVAGDPGLLIFSEVDFALWRESGEVSDAFQERRHGLYCYFLPGGCADGDELPDAAEDHMVIGKSGGPVIRVKADGVELGAGASDFVALAAKVHTELGKIAAAFTSFVPGTGGASFGSPYTTAGDVSATKVKAE